MIALQPTCMLVVCSFSLEAAKSFSEGQVELGTKHDGRADRGRVCIGKGTIPQSPGEVDSTDLMLTKFSREFGVLDKSAVTWQM